MTINPLIPPGAARAVVAVASAPDEFRNPLSATVWRRVSLGLALAACACALWVDLPLMVWMRRSVSQGVNQSFEWVGEMGESGHYIVMALAFYVIGLIGLARGWRNPARMRYASMARGSLLMLATMAVGGLVVLALKRSVARARPRLFFEEGIYGLGEPFSPAQHFHSFPSSHTYTAFAVAVAMGILAPRWRWAFLALAALVAVSRLVNLDHYLSDILAAMAIAIAAGHTLAPRILCRRYQWPLRAPWNWWKKGEGRSLDTSQGR